MENSAPDPKTTCGLCPSPKPAAWCQGCPRERGAHFVDARLKTDSDVVIVAESPVIPRIHDVTRIHTPFMDDAGQLLNAAVRTVTNTLPALSSLTVNKTYAVLCTGIDPKKAILDRCKLFLHNSLGRHRKPPILLAMGLPAAKALGIRAGSLREVQNRVLQTELNGVNYTVLVTISSKMLIGASGKYNVFLRDLQRALEMAAAGKCEHPPLSKLTENYILPTTIAEVRDVCELIRGYAEDGKDPGTWSIAVDTETNTLFPHRPTLKVLGVSFAWATGQSTGIPLWHRETPYDPQAVAPYIQAVLESAKPKIFHNAKFDLKVFKRMGWPVRNLAWDAMLGEHAIEEDKRGEYGLKPLTRVFYPAFAEYADILTESLAKTEGGSQLENIRKVEKEAQKEEKEVLTKGKKRKKVKGADGGFEHYALKDLMLYAAIDTDMTRRLSINQLMRINQEEARIQRKKALLGRDRLRRYPVPNLCANPSPVKSVVIHQAVPLVPVLADMEYHGIKVDREYMDALEHNLARVVHDSREALHSMAGTTDLNLNAPAAVANMLFSTGFKHPETGVRTYYPPVSITEKGQIQTTEKVLKFLVAKHACPFAAKILVYRKATRAKDTFLANVRSLSELDGFLHTNFNIHGTATRRLSSNDENMQNIPKVLAGYRIKKIFIPDDPSMLFCNADAKGAEVVIFSAYSQDAELIRSLNDGMDPHAFFASKIVEAVRMDHDADKVLASMNLDGGRALTYDDFANREHIKALVDRPYGEMLDKFRTAVKRVVFGILYGAGPRKIAETIGISLEQARAIIDLLFQMFPSIPEYIERTKWELRTMGYVETYFGARRRFAIQGATGYLRSKAERQAVNFKIQSTSAQIINECIREIAEPLRHDLNGRLLVTVHDSIGFQIPIKYASQLQEFTTHHLQIRVAQKYPWLTVPFRWDCEVGPNYGELTSLDAYLQGVQNNEETNDIREAYTEEEIRTELATGEQ